MHSNLVDSNVFTFILYSIFAYIVKILVSFLTHRLLHCCSQFNFFVVLTFTSLSTEAKFFYLHSTLPSPKQFDFASTREGWTGTKMEGKFKSDPLR